MDLWVISNFFSNLCRRCLRTVLGFVAADRYTAIAHRGRSVTARAFFSDRLSSDQFQRVIVWRHSIRSRREDLRNDRGSLRCREQIRSGGRMRAAGVRQISPKILSVARRIIFMSAGGYIQTADARGRSRAVWFSGSRRASWRQSGAGCARCGRSISTMRVVANGDAKSDVHVGVSSGTMVVAPLQNGDRPGLITSGEPVELARRFCVANRFYGSRVLIGPRTFELGQPIHCRAAD